MSHEFKGTLVTRMWVIVPFLLYVSSSRVLDQNPPYGGVVYALHITPFLSFGVHWGKNNMGD